MSINNILSIVIKLCPFIATLEGSSSEPITVVPTYNAAILFSITGFLPLMYLLH